MKFLQVQIIFRVFLLRTKPALYTIVKICIWDRTSKNDENKNRVVKVQNSDESPTTAECAFAAYVRYGSKEGFYIQVFLVVTRFLKH